MRPPIPVLSRPDRQMIHNKWRHRKVSLELPRLPIIRDSSKTIWPSVGLKLSALILDKSVGPEIVIVITEPDAQAQDFVGRDLTGLNVKTGLVNTSHGPVFFLLFQFPDPVSGENIVYENSLNPIDNAHIGALEQLASQTHWHVVISDQDRNVVNAFEFPNQYGLATVVPKVRDACSNMQVLDFRLAKREFEKTYSVDDLLGA